MGGGINFTPDLVRKLPLPEYNKNLLDKVADFAKTILAKNTELRGLSTNFTKLVRSQFATAKIVDNWWNLDFAKFCDSLRIKLSLSQRDDLLTLFNKYQPQLAKFSAEIATLDRQINQLVYKLYNLTDDEIAIVEGK